MSEIVKSKSTRLSLHPLEYKEAVSAFLNVKPEPKKGAKPKRNRKLQ